MPILHPRTLANLLLTRESFGNPRKCRLILVNKTRYRLDVAYDGANFCGWAPQPGLRTVGGLILDALRLICSEPPDIVVAARTDAGVHALQQVCHVDLISSPDPVWLLHRLRSLLKSETDLHILSAVKAPVNFHARFSAIGRRYVYRVIDKRSSWYPQNRYFVYRVNAFLQDYRMRRAASGLIGLKDFGAFCKPRRMGSTVRHLRQFEVIRQPDGQIHFFLQSDAFCHSMVRNLVGSLIEVGRGALTLQDLFCYTKIAKRTPKIPTLPPHALTLIGIDYPQEHLFECQNRKTRQKRT